MSEETLRLTNHVNRIRELEATIEGVKAQRDKYKMAYESMLTTADCQVQDIRKLEAKVDALREGLRKLVDYSRRYHQRLVKLRERLQQRGPCNCPYCEAAALLNPKESQCPKCHQDITHASGGDICQYCGWQGDGK